jgi:branched-chain amino acid transport system ATP-binding protein
MTTPLLEIEHVTQSFGSLTVLNDLSFSVATGEALGILGPNGAGKTTLLNVICGEVTPKSGSIRFDGRDITRAPAAQRCVGGIGRTYQVPRPFGGMTVFENALVAATFGRGAGERDSHALCRDVLERTGLFALRDQLASKLRLLDRKRLELARALCTSPRLLLLDEIAGGLTDAEVSSLLQTLASIRTQGVTIIWIEHIVHALASTVDRIMAMNFGSKLIEGAPHEVLNSKAVQEIYLGVE